jgi:hypothetical protein
MNITCARQVGRALRVQREKRPGGTAVGASSSNRRWRRRQRLRKKTEAKLRMRIIMAAETYLRERNLAMAQATIRGASEPRTEAAVVPASPSGAPASGHTAATGDFDPRRPLRLRSAKLHLARPIPPGLLNPAWCSAETGRRRQPLSGFGFSRLFRSTKSCGLSFFGGALPLVSLSTRSIRSRSSRSRSACS